MAVIRTLANLKVGALVLLPLRMTAKGAAGVTLEPQARTEAGVWEPTGSFQVALDGAITGAWTADPRDQPVRVLAFAVTVGDVLFNETNGDTVVVRAVGLGPEGNLWSSDPAGRKTFTGDDWTPVGHLDPGTL